MAVAYLEQDWKESLVATKERGRKFVTAVHVFEGEKGKEAVAFFQGYALRVLDDEGDFLSSTALLNFIKENLGEELWDEEEWDSVVLIERDGSINSGPVKFQGIDSDELLKMYTDCDRYWSTELEDGDDDD